MWITSLSPRGSSIDFWFRFTYLNFRWLLPETDQVSPFYNPFQLTNLAPPHSPSLINKQVRKVGCPLHLHSHTSPLDAAIDSNYPKCQSVEIMLVRLQTDGERGVRTSCTASLLFGEYWKLSVRDKAASARIRTSTLRTMITKYGNKSLSFILSHGILLYLSKPSGFFTYHQV